MKLNLLQKIQNSNASYIIFDIDGTLKDLCKEHTVALRITVEDSKVGKIRENIVMIFNKLAMAMVKTGLFSTNRRKQNLLIRIFSMIVGIKYKKFSNEYFENYEKQLYLFNETCHILTELKGNKTVYFATVNRQNYNFEEYGIPEERIIYTDGSFKIDLYRRILENIGIDKKEVIIVGDNVFDDLISAKLLGTKCLLVNHYNSKLKGVICQIVNNKYLK